MSSLIKQTTQKEDQQVRFVPFGSDEEIKLSLRIIRDYVAVPTREGELPDERDCMKFMMLCRARKLNPFEGDSFLIGFKKRDADKADWSLITAHQTFLKRAEATKDFDGMESGVIISPAVQCAACEGTGRLDKTLCAACNGRGSSDEIMGDFVPAEIHEEPVKLLGGWARVYRKDRSKPFYQRLKLDTYKKPFGVWMQDPSGMICKCAEAAALRQAFPTTLGGLFMREEREAFNTVVSDGAKTPEFASIPETSSAPQVEVSPKLAPPIPTERPAPTPEPEKVKATPRKETAAKPVAEPQPPAEDDLPYMAKHIHFKLAAAGLTDDEILNFADDTGATSGKHESLQVMAEKDPEALRMFHRQIDDIVKRIVSDRRARGGKAAQ